MAQSDPTGPDRDTPAQQPTERDGIQAGEHPSGRDGTVPAQRPTARDRETAAREADVVLADGGTVHLRPIRPDDADAIVALHARFSERTRYLRYFSPYPSIPPKDLARFVHVDHADREAFVAQLGDRLIAVGRYDRLGPQSDEAEVAFVVEDTHQGRGVGSVMLEYLAAAAQEVGIRRFVAEVLPVNGAMLRVFGDAGYQVERRYADGVVHLTFPIEATPASLEVRQAREHRAEARFVHRLLAPRGVALYGASTTGRGVGAALLDHLREYTGPVYPVHPDAAEVAGLPAYRTLAEAPAPVDLAVVAVPADAVPDVVADCAAAGVAAVVVVSAGFAEAGGDGALRQAALVRTARANGMRVVGPNCLGVANPDPQVRLNATLAPQLPGRGRVGFFCQSGALGIALLAEADRRGLGLSSFVSAGNRADVSGNDLLQYWRDDPATDVVLLYLETFGNPRKFARISRALGRHKPVVAVAGAARPAARGGGGPDEAGVAQLFAASGVIGVDTVPELFDAGALLAYQPLPAGRRVAVVTNAAALAALAGDAAVAAGLDITGSTDVGPFAPSATFASALAAALAAPTCDAVLALVAPVLTGRYAEPAGAFAEAVLTAAQGAGKPVLATLLGDPDAVHRLRRLGPAGEILPGTVPAYPSVEEAVRALGRVCRYADWLREPVGTVPRLTGLDPVRIATTLSRPQPDPAELLAGYGIHVVDEIVVPAATPDPVAAAVHAADGVGYPIAVKVSALRQRIDLGAVRLDLAGPDEVRRAARELVGRFGQRVELLVQPMVPPGVACMVEAVQDPAFGPVIGFGLAGTLAELVGAPAWRPVPLTDRDAAALLRAPRGAQLLFGYRGAAPVDEAALVDLLHRTAQLIDECPQVSRLRLNPVLARPDGLSVLHVTADVGTPTPRPDTGPRRL